MSYINHPCIVYMDVYEHIRMINVLPHTFLVSWISSRNPRFLGPLVHYGCTPPVDVFMVDVRGTTDGKPS